MSKEFAKHRDIELWQAFRNGDEMAFEHIYHTYSPLLFNYGRHISRNKQLVEDCIHDLFVYLHKHRTTLGDTDSIKYYLFKSLKRRIAENPEIQSTHLEELFVKNEYNFEMIPSPEFQLIECQSAHSQNKELLNAINLLPKRQREVLYLIYFNNLSYKETAAIMSLEVRTVYNQIYNAIETLRKHFIKSQVFLFITLLILTYFYY